MDEIIQAVRDCPSGALSLEFDGVEARDLAEWHHLRERAIEVSLDGPYRVTGGIPLADAAGGEVPRKFGVIAGALRALPVRAYVQFRDPAGTADPTLFEWAGGLPALTRMTRMLYESLLPVDDLLAPAFADLPPGVPRREAAWLAEAFGGPAQHGVTALAGRDLTPTQRARWAALAVRAADQAGLPDGPAFRATLVGFLDWASRTPADSAAGVPSWDWAAFPRA